MAKKVSSKRLASIAGEYLEMDFAEFCWHVGWPRANYPKPKLDKTRAKIYCEVQALAASVLSQTEPKAKAKRVKKNAKK